MLAQHQVCARSAQPARQTQLEIERQRGHDLGGVAGCAGSQHGLDLRTPQQREARAGIGREQEQRELAAHPLPRDARQRLASLRDRLLELRVRGESELRHQPGGAQDPERVLHEALARGAHRTEPPLRQVAAPVEEIDQQRPLGGPGEGVQREVPVREVVPQGPPRAVAGDVDRPGLGRDHHRAVRETDRHRAREEREHALGRSCRGHVEVGDRHAAQEIPDAATDQHRLVSGVAERAHQAQHRGGHRVECGRLPLGVHRAQCTRDGLCCERREAESEGAG